MILTLTAALSLAAPAPEQVADGFAIRAAVVYLGEGKTLENGVVWVQDGRIRAVGRGVEPSAGTPIHEHDGVLTAGMIGAHAYTGAEGELAESTRSFLPAAEARHAFQPGHSDFDDAVGAGVTSIVLAPRRTNVAGGLTAVVKTSGGTVVEPRAHLHLSLHTTALWAWREPTSWSGALAALNEHLDAGEGAFGEVAAGDLPVVLEAWNRHEVARALELAQARGLTGVLRGGSRAGEMADRVVASGLGVVVGPFTPGSDPRQVRSVVSLAEAGVPIAFGFDTPDSHASSMRLAAAMCVREGLDPVVAWNGLTSTAAALAGVDGRVGRIEKDLDADLVLWSGPPLELTSRIEAVYVDGVRAHGGDL